MPDEVEWQHRIILSTKRVGGYGKKWSSQFQIGVPDLLLVHRQWGTVFLEVKLIKPGAQVIFNRTLGVTEKQGLEMERIAQAGGIARIGVVIPYSVRRSILVVMPHTARRLDSFEIENYPHSIWENKNGFDVAALFDRAALIRTEVRQGEGPVAPPAVRRAAGDHEDTSIRGE